MLLNQQLFDAGLDCLKGFYPDIKNPFIENNQSKPEDIASTPNKVIYSSNKVRLLHYTPKTKSQHLYPVLLVPSIINKAYIMDLIPGFSLVEYLLEQGFSTYMIDWGTFEDEDRFIEFDQLFDPLLNKAVDKVLKHNCIDKLSMVGYCMGGTMSVIYAATHNNKIKNLVNLLGPIDFSEGGMLTEWVDPKIFNPDLLADAYGNVPSELMQFAFNSMKPVAKISKIVKSFNSEVSPEIEKFFNALEFWASDNIPFPGNAYRKYIKDLYQKNLLISGEFKLNGTKVDPHNITCAVLNLVAQHDHIVPPECGLALNNIISSRINDSFCIKGGHVAAVVGPKGRQILWPKVSEWLAKNSG